MLAKLARTPISEIRPLFFRHIGKIGRFCAIASDIQTGHVEHSVELLTPHPMFIGVFDPEWKIQSLYEDREFIEEVRRANGRTIKRLAPIEIGNDVWIGHGVYISRGVKIGDGAVIAARSVVVKDVEPYTIVGGVPARPIRKRFSDKIIEKLLILKWWEYGHDILKGVPIHNIELAIEMIEKRIASGFPKYTPKKIEFDLERNEIHLIQNENRTLLKRL